MELVSKSAFHLSLACYIYFFFFYAIKFLHKNHASPLFIQIPITQT